MPIEVTELDSNVTKVILRGRIDIIGARTIDPPMKEVGTTRKAVVIDLSAVEFMASMGLRSVIMCAKSIWSKNGRVALFAPRPVVADVIRASSIDELIPVFVTEAEAIAAVSAA